MPDMKMCTWIVLILSVQIYNSLDERNFRCKNGKEIPNEWFCDFMDDCGDGSDEEALGCSKFRDWCGRGKFRCDGSCHDATMLCNTIHDCTDGTDELDCECSENHCEQKCFQFRQEPKCLCDENYIGVAGTNNSKCFNKESKKNLMLYSIKDKISVINLYTNKSHDIKTHTEVTSLTGAFGHVYFATYNMGKGGIFKILNGYGELQEMITLDSKVTSMAVDWITNNTYFVTNASVISVCSEKGDYCKQLKNCSRTAHSIGLAPRFGLMFWVEEVDEDNNGSCHYIMKSAMDGTDETTTIKLMPIHHLFGHGYRFTISVDELTENIYYWSDGKLFSISFDEEEKWKLIRGTDTITPAVFTVFETNVYFKKNLRLMPALLDFYEPQFHNQINSIERINIQAFSDNSNDEYTSQKLITFNNSPTVTYLYAYNPKLQRTKISNPCVGSCPNGLCLLRPSHFRKTLDYTCAKDRHSNTETELSVESPELLTKFIEAISSIFSDLI